MRAGGGEVGGGGGWWEGKRQDGVTNSWKDFLLNFFEPKEICTQEMANHSSQCDKRAWTTSEEQWPSTTTSDIVLETRIHVSL